MKKLAERYRVSQPFNYAGEFLRIGDTWSPRGEKWDRLIVETRKVVPVKNRFVAQYSDQTVADLRAELSRRSLPISGKKQELIERLRADDRQEEKV